MCVLHISVCLQGSIGIRISVLCTISRSIQIPHIPNAPVSLYFNLSWFASVNRRFVIEHFPPLEKQQSRCLAEEVD